MNGASVPASGLGIAQTATWLRHLAFLEKRRVRILAGWFLRIGDFEKKYALAYHLYDSAEHVTWFRQRLSEMRGGNPDASVRPELGEWIEEALHAPDDTSFLAGFYGVVTQQLLQAMRSCLAACDGAANANEIRLFHRVETNLSKQMEWFSELGIDGGSNLWAVYLCDLLESIGGIDGEKPRKARPNRPSSPRFERPQTIVFDEKIRIGPLASYEQRLTLAPKEAAIEQFRVFFNEFYAAALLASVLYDGAQADYPWEFFSDFSRHFWDEARHSEFGAVRLRELGVEPDRVNPILFEESQGLPVLHRITYLTRGLETYFMPRKSKRMKEYEQTGDTRSQLFADQDWSDEINHVRYGTRWSEFLLQSDHRDVDDVIEEVKQHLSRVRGQPVTDINAPF